MKHSELRHQPRHVNPRIQDVFKREADGEKVLVAINADENEYTAYFDTECADALNLITGKKEDLSGKIVLPPYSFRFYRCM